MVLVSLLINLIICCVFFFVFVLQYKKRQDVVEIVGVSMSSTYVFPFCLTVNASNVSIKHNKIIGFCANLGYSV